jgi:hypothetical protein
MYQECGTTSITSTLPLQGWTQKTTRRHSGFETTSRRPPSDVTRRKVERKRKPKQTCLPSLNIASEGGRVDADPHFPAQSCENLRPPLDGMGGRDGHLSDEVTL